MVGAGLTYDELRRRHRISAEALKESADMGLVVERDSVWYWTTAAEETYGWAFRTMEVPA